MPTPTLFKKLTSKSNASGNSSAPDVPVNNKEDVPKSTPVTSGDNLPQYSESFKETWAEVYKEPPKAHATEKVLNKIADVQQALTPSSGQQEVVDTLSVPAKALMKASNIDIAEAIHNGVNTFMEAAPPFMKALDEVAKLHPFISAAVLAFKAAYTLEKKRRENDKRVLALYSEMKDMMGVLVHLSDVTDLKKMGPSGKTVEGRIQELCEGAAEDIKKCANVCDTYIKKKLLVKIFAGPIWEPRLVAFVDIFTDRRQEFEFAMSIHVTVGVDTANQKLDVVNKQNAEISEKMDVMMKLFQEFVTPQQKTLAARVGTMDEKAALEDEQTMKELAEEESALQGQSGGIRPFDLVELQQEIRGDPEKAIRTNAELFDRKFEIQRRQLAEDFTRAFKREGDRMIKEITSGPHDRIVDRDIHHIWKDMAWRGSVEARPFVMALRDYYVERAAENPGSLTRSDGWALQYINMGRVPSIREAFDDDSSGFVTVNEANHFTQSRPLNWSLPYWIAYWAIGWKLTCTTYCEMIEDIFDAMMDLSEKVLPENRRSVIEYIDQVWQSVTVFTEAFHREMGADELYTRFESHVAAEEARLRQNFEDINYRVDSSQTIRVIAGEGRLETTLLPMIYLTLKRDLEKISIARKVVLAKEELVDAMGFTTISAIIDVVWDRIESLRTIFNQQNLNAKGQFETFAGGLYKIFFADGPTFCGDQLRGLQEQMSCKDEIFPDPDSISPSILKFPPVKRNEINFAAYDPPEPTLLPMEGTYPVHGVYYGFIYQDGGPADPMMKFTFTKGEGECAFVAVGAHYREKRYDSYEITGTWGPPSEDGKIPVELEISYKEIAWRNTTMKGTYDPEEDSLKGTVAMSLVWETGEFVFKRNPDFVRFYPAPSVTNARKRWEFATTSILDRIRREAWSPKRISKHMKDRKRFVDLISAGYYRRRVFEGEVEESHLLLSGLYEADVQFYASVVKIYLSETPVFYLASCSNCWCTPGGSMIVCMDCSTETLNVNLCSELACLSSTVELDVAAGVIHRPTHAMFKVYRIYFHRQVASVENHAQIILDMVRESVLELEKDGNPMECVRCKTLLSLPCWCCNTCPEVRFICDSCEYKKLAFDETHTKRHIIVRVTKKVEKKERSTEERLQFLEDELTRVRQDLAELKQTLGNLPTGKSAEMSQSE